MPTTRIMTGRVGSPMRSVAVPPVPEPRVLLRGQHHVNLSHRLARKATTTVLEVVQSTIGCTNSSRMCAAVAEICELVSSRMLPRTQDLLPMLRTAQEVSEMRTAMVVEVQLVGDPPATSRNLLERSVATALTVPRIVVV